MSAPHVRPHAPTRASALRRLSAADARLVAVLAPAGYGKSTLLGQWADADDRRFAWLADDDGDRDPERLADEAVAALERTLEGPLPGAWRTPRPPRAGMLPRQGDAAASTGGPVVLVLDDVHLLDADIAAAVIATLVERLPDGSQLVLSGRHGSAAALARLRAEGRLFELGQTDLVLTRSESRALLRQAGLRLSAEDASDLHQRTEGWPAGLYLAALSIDAQGGSRPAFDQVEADRFIADYLRSEVLSRLSDDDIRFVTRSSVLDRLTGALCDALVDRSDSARRLERLEQQGAFVVPLDRRREWYRYHPAFRSLLEAELELREPQAPGDLNRRAADWYEAAGQPERAIGHAQIAGDLDRSGALVEQLAIRVYNSGRVATVEQWLGDLEDTGQLARRPGLAVMAGWVHALRGRPAQADRCADIAASVLAEGVPGGTDPTARPRLSLLEAALCRHGVERMRSDADAAVGSFELGSAWRPKSLLVLGLVARAGGRAGRGRRPAAGGGADRRRQHHRHRVDGAGGAIAAGAIGRRRGGGGPAVRRVDVGAGHGGAARPRHQRDLLRGRGSGGAAARGPRRRRPASGRGLAAAAPAHLRAAVDGDPGPAGAGPRPPRAGRDRAGDRRVRDVREILAHRPDLGALVDGCTSSSWRLAGRGRNGAGGWAGTLTAAELRLLPLLTTHLSFREIADELYVSRNTVKTQAVSAYRKLGASSRSEAVERAAAIGLISAPRVTGQLIPLR